MLDEMAGNVLAVLMYIGAFHDLLKGCGEGGVCSTTLLNLHRSKSSVKTIRRCCNRGFFSSKQWRRAYLSEGFQCCSGFALTQRYTVQIFSTYLLKMFKFETGGGGALTGL